MSPPLTPAEAERARAARIARAIHIPIPPRFIAVAWAGSCVIARSKEERSAIVKMGDDLVRLPTRFHVLMLSSKSGSLRTLAENAEVSLHIGGKAYALGSPFFWEPHGSKWKLDYLEKKLSCDTAAIGMTVHVEVKVKPGSPVLRPIFGLEGVQAEERL